MKSARVVIGSGFGDESKGSRVDFYVNKFGENTLNVRFNGGAQAGHTVVLDDGTRHVFRHFGAGTLAGAATYLSQHFIVNPLLWLKERDELVNKGVEIPQMWINREAALSSPYDMLLNQLMEASRGDSRHGSCGVGIYETFRRHEEEPEFCLPAVGINLPTQVEPWLRKLRAEYLPRRIDSLGLKPTDDQRELIFSDRIIDQYLTACLHMGSDVKFSLAPAVFDRYDNAVFEGAQGLLLDQSHKFFPHVTPSNTGTKNVVDIAEEVGIEHLDVTYATRAYMTRHGAGPLPTEDPNMWFPDETNATNNWQGTLRFGTLDFGTLESTIRTDFKNVQAFMKSYEVTLSVSHIDQIQEQHSGIMRVQFDGTKDQEIDYHDFIGYAEEAIGDVLISTGPEREAITTWARAREVM